LIREANCDLTIVRDSHSVLRRLQTVYPDRAVLVRNLFATWTQLAGLGENFVKAGMAHKSFYRHRKQLLEAGVAWNGSDVLMGDTRGILPADFVPVPGDVRSTSCEHPEVTRLLEEHRVQAA